IPSSNVHVISDAIAAQIKPANIIDQTKPKPRPHVRLRDPLPKTTPLWRPRTAAGDNAVEAETYDRRSSVISFDKDPNGREMFLGNLPLSVTQAALVPLLTLNGGEVGPPN
ncbi:unnamed protein product, partial [Sphacelaria rigidula]